MMRHHTLLVLSCFAMLSLTACAPSSAANENATYQSCAVER